MATRQDRGVIPVRGAEEACVAVLGLGRSGVSAACALNAGGARAVCWDDGAEARAAAEARGLALRDLGQPGALADVAALIVSPGIPHLYPAPHPVVLAALHAGVPLDNDIGLFFRSLGTPDWDRFDTPPRVIAVTGSNGKSTTAALVQHILTHAGRDAQLAGNIGRGVLDIDPPGDGGVVVLELSSYQTDLARALTPDIAIFTNLTPDHLDRHGGIGGYFAAKRRLFAEGGPDRAVVGVDEVEGLFLAGQIAEGHDRLIAVSVTRPLAGPGWSVAAPDGHLTETRGTREVARIALAGIAGLPGAHNHQNACAAYAACRALAVAPRVIEAALHDFPGLPHRSQRIALRQGVAYVNDSKATNADAAAKALQSFDRIRWIAGGLGKEGGIASLTPHLGRVAKAYLIGHSGPAFALQIGATPSAQCGDIATAVARAAAEAEPGDTVLLAPAAASFDQFPDFEARGDAFIAAVRALDD